MMIYLVKTKHFHIILWAGPEWGVWYGRWYLGLDLGRLQIVVRA